MEKHHKSEEEWKEELSEEAFYILRQKGTEAPFTGKYNLHFEDGNYYCMGCQALLFSSETKFDHGCGWPSFYAPVSKDALIEKLDTSIPGRPRIEILCASCEGHLGHVFDDAPNQPTGLRYCINSAAIDFDKE